MRLFLVSLALLFLAAGVAFGQSTGTYTRFGIGCRGSGAGPNYGLLLNDGGGQLAQQPLPNEYAFAAVAPADLTVTGFELFTRATGSASQKVACALYLQDPVSARRAPRTVATATGTMVVGSRAGFHRVLLSRAVPVKEGQYFWIAQQDSSRVLAADLKAGDPPPAPTWWRNGGLGAWATTGILQHPSWRIICAGSGATVHLVAAGAPTLGRPFAVELRYAFGPTLAVLLTGTSRSAIRGVPLPFDLGPLGGSGCRLYVNDTVLLPAPVRADGTARVDLSVPLLPALKGARFFNQFALLDARANPLQLVFTNGGEGRVGG